MEIYNQTVSFGELADNVELQLKKIKGFDNESIDINVGNKWLDLNGNLKVSGNIIMDEILEVSNNFAVKLLVLGNSGSRVAKYKVGEI